MVLAKPTPTPNVRDAYIAPKIWKHLKWSYLTNCKAVFEQNY